MDDDAGAAPVHSPREAALAAVRPPAMGLLVVAILGGAGCLVLAAFSGVGMALQDFVAQKAGEDATAPFGLIAGTVVGGVYVFLAAVWAFVAFGAARMMTLRSYGIGLAAAIVSIVNCSGHLWCCCWPLGIAFGIWSLVVLLQPNVRAAFA